MWKAKSSNTAINELLADARFTTAILKDEILQRKEN